MIQFKLTNSKNNINIREKITSEMQVTSVTKIIKFKIKDTPFENPIK